MKKNIQLIEVCSDLGAGTRGASFGADVLQLMTQQSKFRLLGQLPKTTCNVPKIPGFTSSETKNIEQIYRVCKSISNEVSESIANRNIPLVISGDHSCATGTIAGIKMAKPNARLGVVWIDAHADLHSPYTSPSGNMHGMPLAASANIDNLASAVRDIDAQSKHFWDRLKNLGNIAPKILPQDIVYISLRDFEKEEAQLIRTYGAKIITAEAIRRCGVQGVVDTVLKQLEFCTDIYVSFDTDSLDASVSKGTGLPVADGLMPWEARSLTRLLAQHPKTCCFEVTELNPFFDFFGETTAIVAEIIESAIVAMLKAPFPIEFAYQQR